MTEQKYYIVLKTKAFFASSYYGESYLREEEFKILEYPLTKEVVDKNINNIFEIGIVQNQLDRLGNYFCKNAEDNQAVYDYLNTFDWHISSENFLIKDFKFFVDETQFVVFNSSNTMNCQFRQNNDDLTFFVIPVEYANLIENQSHYNDNDSLNENFNKLVVRIKDRKVT